MIDIRPLDPHLRVMIARFHHGKGLAMAHNYRRVEASPVITSFVFLCHSLSSFDSCHQPPLTCVILCLMLLCTPCSLPHPLQLVMELGYGSLDDILAGM